MSKFSVFHNFDYLKLDYVLLTLFTVISFFGLLILASASMNFSDSIYGSPLSIFNRQLFFFIVGLLGLIVLFLVPLKFWLAYDLSLIHI